jgi:hypothetical protein
VVRSGLPGESESDLARTLTFPFLDIVADVGAGEVRRVLAHVDVKRIAHAIIRQRREIAFAGVHRFETVTD